MLDWGITNHQIHLVIHNQEEDHDDSTYTCTSVPNLLFDRYVVAISVDMSVLKHSTKNDYLNVKAAPIH